MHPDGTSSSPEAVPENTMDTASTGAPSEMPVHHMNTRGLSRARGREPDANAGGRALRKLSSVLQKGNTEIHLSQSNK